MRVLIAAAAALGGALVAAGSPWPPSAYAQAQALLAQMTQDEKLGIVYGYGGGYVGDVPANTRLGIPPLNLEDGPQGVADGVTQVTAWPSALTVCMTWDPAAMYAYGAAMGAEQYIKGTNVMLGPGVNLARVPWGGRTFEYLGEDPFLAATMVGPEVAGIQSNNISACVKHFVDNNQEYNRDTVSENVGRRAQWELYYGAFAAAVDAGVGSAMCSYNRINNTYACENAQTLGDLKTRIGFDGWVMSDWGATHSTIPAANNGLDQQMPDSSFFGAALAAAVAAGNVSEARLDDMVMRILTPLYALNMMTDQPTGSLNANATSAAHNTLARTLAEQSTTLLKNSNGLLPLNASTLKSIAIFGDEDTVHGDGSGGVIPPYIITPFNGIFYYLNPDAPPLPPRPVNCSFVPDVDYYQPGNPCVSATDPQDCCAQCTATTGCNAFTFVPGGTCATPPKAGATAASGACWLKPDNSGLTPHTGFTSGTCAPQPYPPSTVNMTYNSGDNVTAAAAIAAQAQVAVVVVAVTSSEGSDRSDLSLPGNQNALVSAIANAQPNTVVVVRCPGACLMPWASNVSAILYQLMPGQEAGNALANVLFGAVNPSGKLPVSFPASMDDTWLGNPVNPAQYPGTQRNNSWLEADYSEGLLMGYRWYDAQGTDPLWPFGHGLSYTTFAYSGLTVSGSVSPTSNATVSLTVSNAGGVAGAEVAQLYIGYPAAAQEPPKLLKGFSKVTLASGASTPVTFTLTPQQLSIWDVVTDDWSLVSGTYTVLVGSSSRDIRLTGSVTVG